MSSVAVVLAMVAGSLLLCAGFCSAQAVPAGIGPSAESDDAHRRSDGTKPLLQLRSGAHLGHRLGKRNYPTVTYRFARHFFVQALVPWYLTTKNYATTADVDTDEPLLQGKNLIGDTLLEGSVEFGHSGLFYEGTGIIGLPTGNFRFALTAKKTTYNFTNHLELRIGPFTPDIEFGAGNNSFLDDPAVRKGYVAVGPITNFQAGALVQLPFDLELGGHIYEYLPLGKEKVYGTVELDGSGRTVETVDGNGKTEDNGFLVEMNRPLGKHLTLTGVYERSLIQSLNVTSIGVTWTLHVPHRLQ